MTPQPHVETWQPGADALGRPVISVHVKRTHRILPDGRCVPAEAQAPFLVPRPGGPWESDLLPYKPRTDVVVIATCHGRGRRRVTARLRVGGADLSFLVSGPRRAAWIHGRVRFEDPAPFDAVPLRYELAYGGVAPNGPAPPRGPAARALVPDPRVYPRNPVGRGYVLDGSAEAVDGLELPQVEHPADPLLPERLITGDPACWWQQPLPWSCDWVGKTWFPRVTHLGALPPDLPDDEDLLAEVRLGLIPRGHLRAVRAATRFTGFDPRLADAASPALVLPWLRADEVIALDELDRTGRLRVRLPGARPRVSVRWRKRTEEVPVVPHRVLLAVEEARVSVVWNATWPAPEALLARRSGPLDVDVQVDGRPVLPLGAAVPAITSHSGGPP